MWPLLVAAVVLLAPVALYSLFRCHGPRIWLLAIIPVSLATPLLVPAHLPMVRFFVGIGALVNIAKAIECLNDRVRDPAMVQSFWRFLFWHTIPPDSTWPTDADAATAARRDGRRRLLRGAAKLPFVAGLVILHTAIPRIQTEPWLSVFWTLWFSYTWVSAVVDLVTGLAMQTGVHVAEVFDAPPLARSPAEFWSRRWNLFFSSWARRNLFLQLGGRRRPGLALLAVFAASALAHEYLVTVSLGNTGGHITAYFMLQGIATLVTIKLGRLRRGRQLLPTAAAVPLHLAWFTLTAPLFFEPVMKVFCLETLGVR